jgi:hypothetical protein
MALAPRYLKRWRILNCTDSFAMAGSLSPNARTMVIRKFNPGHGTKMLGQVRDFRKIAGAQNQVSPVLVCARSESLAFDW